MRFVAGFPKRNGDDGIRDAEGDGGGSVHAGDFFEHEGVVDRVRAGAAPFFGDEHAAAAELAEFRLTVRPEFFLAPVFAEDRAHSVP